ncbi:MAG: Imm44 family immunity protein [Phycisphaerales bacterium]|nr:Imm44 family immunity protein [Phycisphaerales bacterium]
MRFWMSAEIDVDVNDAYERFSLDLQMSLDAYLSKNDYGGGLKQWAYMDIIIDHPDWFPEICKYHRKRQVIEFRLQIPYDQFKSASPDEQRRMVFASILRSTQVARESGKLPKGFDLDRFIADLKEFGQQGGWM